MVLLKYSSNFWRTLEMPLSNCEVNLFLTWSENCVIGYNNVSYQGVIFEITQTKPYVPVVTLSAQDHSKLLTQLKSGFKRTINWNICFGINNKGYYLRNVEIRDYKVTIDGETFLINQ